MHCLHGFGFWALVFTGDTLWLASQSCFQGSSMSQYESAHFKWQNIPLYGCSTFCYPVIMDVWASTWWLLRITILCSFCVDICSVLLSRYLGMGWATPSCLYFSGSACLLFAVASSLYNPASSLWGLQPFHIFINTCQSNFLNLASSWWEVMSHCGSDCISFISCDVEKLPMCFPAVFPSSEMSGM